MRRIYLSDISYLKKKIEDSTSDSIHVWGLNMFLYRLHSLTLLYASYKVANYKANDHDRTNICLKVRARDQLTEYERYSFCSHFTETVNLTVFLFSSIHTAIPSSLSSLAPPSLSSISSILLFRSVYVYRYITSVFLFRRNVTSVTSFSRILKRRE